MKIYWHTKKTPLKLLALLLILLAASVLLSWWSASFGPSALRVVRTVPQDQSLYSPYLPVIITFNRTPNPKEVVFTVSPTTEVSFSSPVDKTITITPKDIFQPKMNYQIQINTSPLFTLSFTTTQAEETAPGYKEAFQRALQLYQQQHGTQDTALQNIRKNAPIQQPEFTITYSYADNTYGVALVSPYDQSKAAFLSWLKQLGITDTSGLRINYINK